MLHQTNSSAPKGGTVNNIIKLACIALVLVPMGASAQSEADVGFRGWGPRLGVTVNPDQFHFGAHLDFGNFARHVRFQPNVEVGLGDDLTLVAVNMDAAYRFVERWEAWTPYLGGGLGINIFSDDESGVVDESNTELGVHVLGGIEKGLSTGDRFFVEAKVGLVDETPDFKGTAGWTFYH
jgi:hypothetical protein